MFTRLRAFLLILSAFAAAPAIAQAPAAAPAQTQTDPNAPALSEPYQDWTLRCFNVASPAPCDILQVAVNRQSQQRMLSATIAYIPARSAFAMQIAVPLGVTLSKGLTLNAGDHTLKNVHFARCARDGCYIEIVVDEPTIQALGKAGQSTTIVIYPYNQNKEFKLPLSLKGFDAAIARLKVLAAQRATRVPAQAAPGATPAAPAPARTPARPATPPGH